MIPRAAILVLQRWQEALECLEWLPDLRRFGTVLAADAAEQMCNVFAWPLSGYGTTRNRDFTLLSE
jgi:hypothetical protein